MEKILWKNFKDKTDNERTTLLFLSFCRALNKYFEEVGIADHRNGAARVLHDATLNTFAKIRLVTPAHVGEMNKIITMIPDMFFALLNYSGADGYLRGMERMSEMSLAEVAAALNIKSHKR